MRESTQDGLGQYRGGYDLNSIHVVGYGILLMRKANAGPAEGLSSAEAPDPRVAALPQSVLYHIVRDHFETFRAQAASLREGEGTPRLITSYRTLPCANGC